VHPARLLWFGIVIWRRKWWAAALMEENPTALRLKELETLEKVTEKIDKISVFGGLDGVLNGLINIQTTPPK
jgi:hypothetical protein